MGDVRGGGLFCGVEFVRDKKTKEPISEAHMGKLMGDVTAEGVLVGRTSSSLPGMNTIMNFAPSLVITRDQIDTIVAAVRRAVEKNLQTDLTAPLAGGKGCDDQPRIVAPGCLRLFARPASERRLGAGGPDLSQQPQSAPRGEQDNRCATR